MENEKQRTSASRKFLYSFLYGKTNHLLILTNAVIAIFVVATYSRNDWQILQRIDAIFTILFLIEITLKLCYTDGLREFFVKSRDRFGNPRVFVPQIIDYDNPKYTSIERTVLRKIYRPINGISKAWFMLHKWNTFDFIIVGASLPTILLLIPNYDGVNLNFILVCRTVRLFKALRLFKLLRNDVDRLMQGIAVACRKAFPVIVIFLILMLTLGFVLCFASTHFGIGTKYFDTPLNASFTLFQLFTYDGWRTIPDSVAKDAHALWPACWWLDTAVNMIFCIIVGLGGIIGIALINSVFVDGMMLRDKSDEERDKKLVNMQTQLVALTKQISDMQKKL